MTGLLKLTFVELKLLLRDLGSLISMLVIPLFVLLIFGISYKASNSALPSMSVAIALALNALYVVPTYLGTYREQGILRRLSTTPMSPATLLVAQLLIHLLITVVSSALVVGLAAALGIALPRNVPGAVLTFALGITAMFAIGVLIAAVAPNGRTAAGIGVLLYFPLAFLGGITLPREQMPPLFAQIGDWTPLGAFRQALADSWTGTMPQTLYLVIMTGYAIVVGALATRFFRWE